MESNEILLNSYIKDHVADVCKILENSDNKSVCHFLSELPTKLCVDLLTHMEINLAAYCVEEMNPKQRIIVFESLPQTVTEMLLRRLSADTQKQIFENLKRKTIESIKLKLKYEENRVGAKMNTDILTFPEDITVDSAMNTIKTYKEKVSQNILM